MEGQLITTKKERGVEFLTPLRPMCSAICPLAIAPTMAPTLDSEPNAENCSTRGRGQYVLFSGTILQKKKETNLRDVD